MMEFNDLDELCFEVGSLVNSENGAHEHGAYITGTISVMKPDDRGDARSVHTFSYTIPACALADAIHVEIS